MPDPQIRWLAGDADLGREVARQVGRELGQARLLRDAGHRRHLRLDAGPLGSLFLKQFRVGRGSAGWLERAKVRLGRAAAQREWRSLLALHAAGAPVPRPLALGRLAGGDLLLVVPWTEGRPLAAALGRPAGERREALRALGAAVARLHGAGFVHGDLHRENVLLTARGPLFLDLQAARATKSPEARAADLGFLDHSLASLLSTPDRVRLRAAALGLRRPFDPAAREALRAVGRAAEAKALLRAANRTRRALRPGREQASLVLAGGRGLRAAAFPAEAVADALAAHRDALARGDARALKHDARSHITAVSAGGRHLIVKEVLPRGLARPLADLARGSPARRAWRAARGLAARRIGAPEPLAFLERRRLGLPVSSLLLLEDLRPALPADGALERGLDARAVLDALATLALALHRRGVDHGDLKASHVWLAQEPRGLAPRLIDLEGVRFRRRLPERTRLLALAQLNASLPDAFPAAERRRAFARYARALPFAAGARAALAAVVSDSLARRHRWSGAGCTLAEQRLSASR